ncbi:hypothetical protein BSL78_02720 [Apostichopus japonicus]|uniref:Uncharacterized protein n=1 Tax=Stichopus japonicus TaxID=307972 RepID=A0A2G8LJD4_STIJA|nr:hypothetical protein BSL78_02720 [Apostichopus japonicus]
MDSDLDETLTRPYTSTTFGIKLRQFQSLIAELTQQDSEASAEQRRQAINESLRFDTFCEAIRALFGPDIRSTDLKAIFRKISTNPDAEVDWSEIFGYFQTEDEDPEQVVNEDISVFTVAKKQKIGEAAGDKKRRDVVYALMSSPQIDIYVSASQKGAVAVWNSKSLKLVSCCDLNETTWTTGVDYLPTLRRLAITSERSLCIWDYRAKGKNQVKYLPDLECFASCSASSTSSFILETIDRLKDNQNIRPVAIPRGVNAFAFCSRANVIATGGNDKMVRIWHPHIFTRPTGKLIGHLFTIIDIAVNEKDQHVISLSTARVFRIWDIHTLTSLQVFADNEERPGEKRIHHILFDEKHERLIAASSVWMLGRYTDIQDKCKYTHPDRPVCQVLYNTELNQVITVCTESVIKVWEMETGKLVYMIKDSHGANVEVTAIAVDETGYRLASGAVDGSIKVWTLEASGDQNWYESHSAKDDELSITSLVYCRVDDRRCIAVCGWNNKLRLIEDSLDHGDLTLYAEFSDTLKPSSSSLASRTLLEFQEMSCMSFLSPDIIITGCNSGDLILWDTYSAIVKDVFHIVKTTVDNDKRTSVKAVYPKKVHAVMFLVHRTRQTDPHFIKRLTDEGHIQVAKRVDKEDTSEKSESIITEEGRSNIPEESSTEPEKEEREDSSQEQIIDQEKQEEAFEGIGEDEDDIKEGGNEMGMKEMKRRMKG